MARLSYVEDNHRNTFSASLTENEVLQNLTHVGYD